MALETLNGVTQIGGFNVIELEQAKELPEFKNPDGGFNWDKYDEFRKSYPIGITHKENMISFRIQNGPVKEHGINGCQIDTLIECAKIMLEGLNRKFPCSENENAIGALVTALWWLEHRKADRKNRGDDRDESGLVPPHAHKWSS